MTLPGGVTLITSLLDLGRNGTGSGVFPPKISVAAANTHVREVVA